MAPGDLKACGGRGVQKPEMPKEKGGGGGVGSLLGEKNRNHTGIPYSCCKKGGVTEKSDAVSTRTYQHETRGHAETKLKNKVEESRGTVAGVEYTGLVVFHGLGGVGGKPGSALPLSISCTWNRSSEEAT